MNFNAIIEKNLPSLARFTRRSSSVKKRMDCLGVDIGWHSIKVVRIKSQPAGLDELVLAAMIEKPQPGETLGVLHEFIRKKKLMGLPAAVCMDDPTIKIRKIELPKMPDADLKEAIKWKMRDIVDGSVEDYVIRYSSLSAESKDSKKLVLVGYAMKKQVVVDWCQTITKAGLTPVFLEPSAVSMAAIVEKNFPSDEHWIAAIDLGFHKAIMTVTGNGRYYFSRPVAGVKLSGFQGDEASYNQKLAAEVQNTLDTFAITFRVERINRILLCGGGACRGDVAEYLSRNLGIPTEVMNPFRNIQVPEGMAVPSMTHLYAHAVSLAQVSP